MLCIYLGMLLSESSISLEIVRITTVAGVQPCKRLPDKGARGQISNRKEQIIHKYSRKSFSCQLKQSSHWVAGFIHIVARILGLDSGHCRHVLDLVIQQGRFALQPIYMRI